MIPLQAGAEGFFALLLVLLVVAPPVVYSGLKAVQKLSPSQGTTR
ncbi:hypothetical protein ACFQH3_01075 [Haladaptatus sp. GCM10025707]|nr:MULTISPECIES: hypothetical protein [unclassified Haladaptatus]